MEATENVDIAACGEVEDDMEEGCSYGPRSWQRFYMGYKERFVDDCIVKIKGGKVCVRLAQAPSAKASAKRIGARELDKESDPALTGTTVWDGAVVLSHFVTETPVLQQHAEAHGWPSGGRLPHCLELGAGTGAVSLSLLACRQVASASITDIPDMLPHLRHNVGRNSSMFIPSLANVQALRWGPPGADLHQLAPVKPPFDLIVGSDLIYYTYSEETPHTKLLLWTLRRVAAPTSLVLLALSLHHNPEEVEHFLGLAQEHFHVQRIKKSELPEEMRVPDVIVVAMRLKQETCSDDIGSHQ